MKKLKYILLLLILLGAFVAKAQQETMYNMYMNQLLTMNPAYAGAKGVTSAAMLVREQLVGFKGHPSTQTISVHSPLSDQTGIGGSIEVDRIGDVGAITRTTLSGDYSYTITYPGQRYLALGLKIGTTSYYATTSAVDVGSLGDMNDPQFLNDVKRPFLPNAGVGVYFSTPDYYLGFSTPKLISNRITVKDVETGTVSREEFHAFFMGGYVFDINRIVKFKPYFMVRMAMNSPMTIDLTAQFVLIDRLWIGATYRVQNSVGGLMQVQATDQLKIGYSYDLMTTEVGQYNKGTHEVFLSFDFSFGRGRVRSPRYF